MWGSASENRSIAGIIRVWLVESVDDFGGGGDGGDGDGAVCTAFGVRSSVRPSF